MPPRDPEQMACERFLRRIRNWADPTWGFYVYGTYTRPEGEKDTSGEASTDPAATTDDAYFQSILSKLHAHATDSLRYSYPEPYNQEMIDTLRLEPAALLPGASLADVCEHFRQNYAVSRSAEPHDQPYVLTEEDEKCGPKWAWCLVVDDESLQSIQSGPEPFGPTPPEGTDPFDIRTNAFDVFVKLLSKDYTTMEKPVVLAAQGRRGGGRRKEWNGWLKFSIDRIKGAFEETAQGDPETYFESPDKIVLFSV